jgi:hypothetical protein
MVGVEGFKFLYFHLIFLYGLVTTVDRVFYYFLERTCRIIVYSDEVIVWNEVVNFFVIVIK